MKYGSVNWRRISACSDNGVSFPFGTTAFLPLVWIRVQHIDTHLDTASVILLLISADFLASDYCYGIEMKRALERQATGQARVIPILVRPVDLKAVPFANLQALPTDASDHNLEQQG